MVFGRQALGTTTVPHGTCPSFLESVCTCHASVRKCTTGKTTPWTTAGARLHRISACLSGADVYGPRLAGRLFQRHGAKISLHILLEGSKRSLTLEGLPLCRDGLWKSLHLRQDLEADGT